MILQQQEERLSSSGGEKQGSVEKEAKCIHSERRHRTALLLLCTVLGRDFTTEEEDKHYSLRFRKNCFASLVPLLWSRRLQTPLPRLPPLTFFLYDREGGWAKQRADLLFHMCVCESCGEKKGCSRPTGRLSVCWKQKVKQQQRDSEGSLDETEP